MSKFVGEIEPQAALAAGSGVAYIHEDPFAMKEIMHDVTVLKTKISEVILFDCFNVRPSEVAAHCKALRAILGACLSILECVYENNFKMFT